MKTLTISNSYETFYCITKTLQNSRMMHVKDTQEAISLLANEDDFDLIFLDDTLEKSDVIEFFITLEKLNNPYRARSLFLTQEKDTDFVKQIIQLGCTQAVSKCSSNDILAEEIKPHLEIMKLKNQLDRNLSHQHSLFKTIYQQSPIGIVLGNKQKINGEWEGIFLDVNQALLNITNYKKEYLLQHGWERITHPEDTQKNRELYQAFYNNEISKFTIEKRYIRKDGEIIWVLMDVTSLETDESSSTFLCLIQNVTERKLIEQALQESERAKSVLLSNLPGMAYRCFIDNDWTMKFVSLGCLELTGYSPEDLIDNKTIAFNDIIASEYRQMLWDKWQEAIVSHDAFEYEYEIICANKERKWVLEKGEAIYDDKNHAVAIEGMIFNITRRKNYEEKLKFLSEHDTLTGLYNREYLSTRLKKLQPNHKNALMIVNFHRVNSLSLTYGFSFSEQIVRELSRTILALFDTKREVYQVSFERVGVLIKNYDDQESLIAIANEAINACLTLDITKIIGCNVGILQIDECYCDCDAEQMIRNASIASEQHYKQMTSINFFTSDLSITTKRESEIKNALIQYVDNPDNHFYLNFQPILETTSKKVVGFEALSRFEIDELGSISPNEFIPLAEETQVILPLGDIIFEKACQFKQACDKAGYPHLQISINISMLQLLKDEFVSDFMLLFSKYDIDLKTVQLEVTESIFSDNFINLNEKLQQLRLLGVKIAIDDFGTGYSSFARERELMIDTIKVDKQFIDRIFNLPDNQLVTSDIIAMAHKLNYRVVAEGVENKRQYDYLSKYECDLLQGYYFSKPLPFRDALDFLHKQNG